MALRTFSENIHINHFIKIFLPFLCRGESGVYAIKPAIYKLLLFMFTAEKTEPRGWVTHPRASGESGTESRSLDHWLQLMFDGTDLSCSSPMARRPSLTCCFLCHLQINSHSEPTSGHRRESRARPKETLNRKQTRCQLVPSNRCFSPSLSPLQFQG